MDSTVSQVKKYLRMFSDILFLIQEDKDSEIAIGGIFALKLHGLKVRDTNELDIIVYNPNIDLIDQLQVASGLHAGSIPEDQEGNKWRGWKIEKGGLTIDFIMEWDEKISEDLLTIHWGVTPIKIQSVHTVLSKKKSYDRPKDHKDFEQFIIDNF
jgi:hypothetical protein